MYKRLTSPKRLLNVRVYFLDPCYFLYLGAERGNLIHVYSEVSLTRSSFKKKNVNMQKAERNRRKRNRVDLIGVGLVCGLKKNQVSSWKLVCCFWISTFDTERNEWQMVHLISRTCPVYRNEAERLTFSCSYCFSFFFYICCQENADVEI